MGKATFTASDATPLVFSINPIYPSKTTVYSGCVQGQTEGGEEYVYEKGTPYVLIELRFEDLPSSDIDGGFDYTTRCQAAGTQSLINWFINVYGASRNTFIYCDPFGKDHPVTISGDRLEFALTEYGRYNGQIVLKKKLG